MIKKIITATLLLHFWLVVPVRAIESSVVPPEIQPRSSWITKTQEQYTKKKWKPKKRVNKLLSDFHSPKYFIIHHTEKMEGEDSQEIMRKIFQAHAVDRGWGDIGYNYVIDEEGVIFEARKGGNGVRGAHSLNSFTGRNYNYESIGIAVIGDYNTEKLSDEAEESLARLIGWLSYANAINLAEEKKVLVPINQRRGSFRKSYKKLPTLLTHRDVDETSCPGDGIYSKLDDIKDQAIQFQSTYQTYAYTVGGKQGYIFKKGYRQKPKTNMVMLSINQRWFDIFKKK